MVITPLTKSSNVEPLTDLPILKMARYGEHIGVAQSINDCRHEVVGLPALHRDRLYMVPFTGEGGRRLLAGTGNVELEADTKLLFVNWHVQFA